MIGYREDGGGVSYLQVAHESKQEVEGGGCCDGDGPGRVRSHITIKGSCCGRRTGPSWEH